MGADIHMQIEHKVKGGWKFYPYKRIGYDGNYREEDLGVYICRDYQLFGMLANLREGADYCISEPRGLPKDLDKKTLYAFQGTEDKVNFDECYHTPSWLLVSELLEFISLSPYKKKQTKKKIEFLNEIDFDWLFRIIRENIDSDLKNIRLVFYFDS